MAACLIASLPIAFMYNLFLDRFIAGFHRWRGQVGVQCEHSLFKPSDRRTDHMRIYQQRSEGAVSGMAESGQEPTERVRTLVRAYQKDLGLDIEPSKSY